MILVVVFAAAVGVICSAVYFVVVSELYGVAEDFQYIKDELRR